MKYQPSELLEEAKRRKSISNQRLALYDRSHAAYFGDKDGDRMGVEGMDSTGRTVLRIQMLRQTLATRQGAPNLLMPIVDDFVGSKGPLPNMKVPAWDETEDAHDKAAKFSRILRTQWRNSKMDMQSYKMAWYLSCLGDCLLTLNPLFPDQATFLRPPGIYISVIDPRTAFPQYKTGWESEELRDVIIWERFTKEQAYAEWGVRSTENFVDALWYIGDNDNCLVVMDRLVSQVEHGLGFCPAQWLKNKMNGRPAQSDIIGAVEAHEEMQVMVQVMNDSLMETTYGQLVVKNPANVNDDFEVGPGAEPIVVQGDGDVTRLAPAPPPQSAQMLMQNMWELIQRVAGTSPIRVDSNVPGSNISGRSVRQQTAPMETRLAAWQTFIGYHLESLNSKILWMFYTLPDFKDTFIDVWGTEKGKPFKDRFQGSELEGWTRNEIQWAAVLGTSAHERSVVALGLKDKDLVPDEWVLEQIGIDDPEYLIDRARGEAKDRMQQQAAMQPPQGGPGGPPPPGGGQAGPQGGPPPGGPPGGGGPAQPPAGLPPFEQLDTSPTQGGMGTPNQVPDVRQQLQQALAAVADQVQGTIVNAHTTGDGVHITLQETSAAANNADRQMLRQALTSAGFAFVTFSRAS